MSACAGGGKGGFVKTDAGMTLTRNGLTVTVDPDTGLVIGLASSTDSLEMDGIFVDAGIARHNLVLRRTVHDKRNARIGNIVYSLVQTISYLVFGAHVFGNDIIARTGLFAACAQRKQRNSYTYQSNYLQ